MNNDQSVSLARIIGENTRVPELEGTTPDRVIAELLEELAERESLDDAAVASIRRAVMSRESEASTGIGNGLGLPHMKNCPFVDRIRGVFGRSREGVDFGSTDGELVHVFFLFLTPEGMDSEHVQLMRRVVTMSRDGKTMRYLIENESLESAAEIFREIDTQFE